MSDSNLTLAAEKRTQFGKGAARRIRRDHKIPIQVVTEEIVVKLAKDIQRDAIKPVIEHIDLVVVRKGEKVTVDVPVHVEGEAAPETIVTVDSQTLQLEVEATHIPENVVVSVEGLEAGTQIKASDVTLPRGAVLVVDEETLVVNITQQISQEELEAELAEAEEVAGIEREESDEDAAAAEGDSTEGDSTEGDATEGDKAESQDA